MSFRLDKSIGGLSAPTMAILVALASLPAHADETFDTLLAAPQQNSPHAVAATLRTLRARPGVRFTRRNGWTMAEDRVASTSWWFAPVGHPAYPLVIRRMTTVQDGETVISTCVMCESSQDECSKAEQAYAATSAPWMR